jgi:hypothetical protein
VGAQRRVDRLQRLLAPSQIAEAGDRARDRMAMLDRFVERCAAAGARFARTGDVARELS